MYFVVIISLEFSDKYCPCAKCKYKVLLKYKTLELSQKVAGMDFVCNHCKKAILQNSPKYNDSTQKNVGSFNSIQTSPSLLSIPQVQQYKEEDHNQNSLYSPTKTSEKEMDVSTASKEMVATYYDTLEMQKEFKEASAGLKPKEGINEGDKYFSKQVTGTSDKHPGYALLEEQKKFCFDSDLDKREPLQYTSIRSSTEIIKYVFEKEDVEYIGAKNPSYVAESVSKPDWSAKIAKKYATENKLKCLDMESFENFDQNNPTELLTTEIDTGKELDDAEGSTKVRKAKILRKKRISKKRRVKPKQKGNKGPVVDQTNLTGESEGDSRDSEKDKKKINDTSPDSEKDKENLNDTPPPSEASHEIDEQSLKTVTETKFDRDDDKWGQEKKEGGDGEEEGNGDQSQKAKEIDIKSEDKVFKNSKKVNVTKTSVRNPKISHKQQSRLKDVTKRVEEKERGVRKKHVTRRKNKLSDSNEINGTESHLDIQTGDRETPEGTIRYALSDRRYIDEGWTKLPTQKTVRKMILYKMKQSHPEFDWFNRNKHKKEIFYNTGEKLADFEVDVESNVGAKGEKRDRRKNVLYYRNGKVALEHYTPEEANIEKRIVVYSKGGPDGKGRIRPSTVLAIFDHLGNGVVYDHDGNVRLKYNQTEGVLLDKTVGPFTHWKWHTLNDPPELKDVMTETVLVPKDMNIAKLGKPSEVNKVKDEEIQAIAMENFIRSKRKKFKPFSIKMKVVKINENFSLNVIDQATIILTFKDHPIHVRTNVGMVLDQKDIVDTELVEIGDVSMNADKVPPGTASLAALQSQKRHVQRLHRKRCERETLLHLKQSSIDRLYAGVSKPRTREVIAVQVDKACQCDLLGCD